MEFFRGKAFDLLAADGDDFINSAVSDDFAHDTFGKIPEGGIWLADCEEVLLWFFDAILYDPFYQCGIEIASDHRFLQLLLSVASELPWVGGSWSAETEFLLKLAGDFYDFDFVDAVGELEAESGLFSFDRFAEAEDDGLGICRDCIEAGDHADDHEECECGEPDDGEVDIDLFGHVPFLGRFQRSYKAAFSYMRGKLEKMICFELSGRLTRGVAGGIDVLMKTMLLLFGMCSVLWAQDAIVEKPSPEVARLAVKAVEELGQQVVQGKYMTAVEKMYPRWKERTAARMGGMEAMEAKLAAVPREMLKQGMSITQFQPIGVPEVYEVGMGKAMVMQNGTQVEKIRYTKWMVLVPTSTHFRMMVENNPRPIFVESISFQIAISDKNALNWTFIDGSGIGVNELRSLFVNLPMDLKLPALEKREIK